VRWLLDGVALHPAIVERARLADSQRADGGWPSEGGLDRDVHATLKALRVLAAT
jgi:hypothetical protein